MRRVDQEREKGRLSCACHWRIAPAAHLIGGVRCGPPPCNKRGSPPLPHTFAKERENATRETVSLSSKPKCFSFGVQQLCCPGCQAQLDVRSRRSIGRVSRRPPDLLRRRHDHRDGRLPRCKWTLFIDFFKIIHICFSNQLLRQTVYVERFLCSLYF